PGADVEHPRGGPDPEPPRRLVDRLGAVVVVLVERHQLLDGERRVVRDPERAQLVVDPLDAVVELHALRRLHPARVYASGPGAAWPGRAHGGSGRAARYRGARGEVPRASARHRWRRTTVIVWTHLLRLRGRPLGSFLLEQRRLPDRSQPVLEAVWLGETETDG